MNSTNKSVSTNLGHIHLTISGSGPTMIFWPSLMMDGSMWHQQALHFKDDYQVIMIDGPGHGQSEDLNRHFTLEECALCLSQIMDELEISSSVIVGNSWGGMVGGVFAALYPHRTTATVLMNCTASAASLKQKIEFYVMSLFTGNSTHMPKRLVNQAAKTFIGNTTENKRNEVYSQIRTYISKVNLNSARWAIESIFTSRHDQHKLLSQIKSPTLVIAGKEDRTFTVAETRKMAEAIPGSLFEVLDEVGHSAALEDPKLVNERIECFLNKSKGIRKLRQ